MNFLQDPLTSPQVVAFLTAHLADMHATSPAESVHALDLAAYQTPAIRLWTAWEGERLLGTVALQQLSATSGELKSMRVEPSLRGQGIGRALLQHAEQMASNAGWRTLYLETGSMDFFQPARQLYLQAGFVHCGPFATYTEDPLSVYMMKSLQGGADVTEPVARQLAAYNAKDLAAFVRCYHPDIAVYRALNTPPVLQGIAAFRQFYAEQRFSLPVLHADVLTRMVIGQTVIDHERVIGIGPEPTEVAVIYTVKQGLITQVLFLGPGSE